MYVAGSSCAAGSGQVVRSQVNISAQLQRAGQRSEVLENVTHRKRG